MKLWAFVDLTPSLGLKFNYFCDQKYSRYKYRLVLSQDLKLTRQAELKCVHYHVAL